MACLVLRSCMGLPQAEASLLALHATTVDAGQQGCAGLAARLMASAFEFWFLTGCHCSWWCKC